MPNLEPVVLQSDQFRLRHIGPKDDIWPTPSVSTRTYTVLAVDSDLINGQGGMVARPLPQANLPTSDDFVSGQWTGRREDAGEMQLTFPNATASDGVPWRQRFDTEGHEQFIEIYYNGEIDGVYVLDTITPDGTQVQVHGQDGWFLLKKAYARDWFALFAARDVIERGTQLWVPIVCDEFSSSVLDTNKWTPSVFSGQIIPGQTGVKLLAFGIDSYAVLISNQFNVPTGSMAWSATGAAIYSDFGNQSANSNLAFKVQEVGDAVVWQIVLSHDGTVWFNDGDVPGGGITYGQTTVAIAPRYSFMIENDGTWVWAFVNGVLVGKFRRSWPYYIQSLRTTIALNNPATGGHGGVDSQALVQDVVVEALEPFLQRGTDKGDYVLQGDATTYPFGGLHGRYYNDLDLQSDFWRLQKVMHPSRSSTYGSSSPQEFANQQDPSITQYTFPPAGGGGGVGPAKSNWSVQWFGSIYLRFKQGGAYGFVLQTPSTGTINGSGSFTANSAVRVWIGKTQAGDALVDEWSWQSNQLFGFQIHADDLAGTLSDGTKTWCDGWYPIKIEYAVDNVEITGPILWLTFSPLEYQDPGGTTIQAGLQSIPVPSTSLSPLGMVDNRYQGMSHFDMVQQTVTGFGYQATVAPKQLESGLFPGVLASRLREGQNTDVVLKPDVSVRQDGEGLVSYSSTEDATDWATSLQGNGAGMQNGTVGQLQARVVDCDTLKDSMFDAQAWQDFSDASFMELLQALLTSQLGLRIRPWQLLSADPTGRPRQAYTWPLPGKIANMRWRPGDGLFIRAQEINVWDTDPRAILVITRSITPNGFTGTQVNFANRPRNQSRSLKQQFFQASRWQRNYQRQLVVLTGTHMDAIPLSAGQTSTSPNESDVSLQPGDKVVRASLHLNYNIGGLGATPSGQPMGVLINGVDRTTSLSGDLSGNGWATFPAIVDITPWMAPDIFNRVSVSLKNNGSINVIVSWQLYVDVLR